ncbi:MAG: outer membrane protein transport protein [Candidatus Krumholzibacteria bacterium]|nr:outer membrane protein transport protein [Candidatus Krumholzibacteria bacterium]
MKSRRATFLFYACLAGLVPFATQTSYASNGMNMIGFGPQSVAMAGADLAITNSPSAMNINPAGIGRCVYPQIELGLSLLRPSLSHADGFGNDREDVAQRYPVPFLAYVHPVRDFTFGMGVFVQGGLGAEYEGFTTPFSAMANSGMLPPGFFAGDAVPITDNTLTSIMHAKITPTAAWRVHPSLTVGANLNLSYARAEMKLFPNTSVMADIDRSGTEGDSPRDFFSGMHVRDMSSTGYGVRVGFQYEVGALTLGGAYCTETSLDFEDGTMTLNLSSLGLGRVDYDATASGLSWPAQAGVGAAYQVSPQFLLAADVDWVNWSDAIETLTIKIANPDVPMAPPSREIPFQMDWQDQWVWAVGIEVTPVEDWAFRLGYNHGDTPIPSATLKPLFPAIAENHVTGGFGVTRGRWSLDLGMEYVIEAEKTNTSLDPAANPFGQGSQETLSQFVGHLMARFAFSS